MTKVPRDISGLELATKLKIFGYHITRQTGSHIRLTTSANGVHNITIPGHDPLKIGTLSSILHDVANHLNKDKSELLKELFR